MTVALRQKQQLHVVLITYPAKGHSIPLLHFAKRLHSMGVMVTFVNTYNHLSNEHFRTLDGLDSNMRVVTLGVTPIEGEGMGSLPYIEHVNELVSDAELLVEKLFARQEDAPPVCIVSDMFLGWTQEVANKFNIPRYVLFASPGTGLATMLHMPELIKQGRLPLDIDKQEELVYDIPGVPPTRLADLPAPMLDANDYFYSFYVRNCEQMYEATGVLTNSFYEMESFTIDTLLKTTYGNKNGHGGHLLSILPVGPMLPMAYFSTSEDAGAAKKEDRDPCLQWMDTQPDSSVLYISFGSVAALSIPQIKELSMGLEASGQRFLLVLRPPLNPENLPLLPEGFLERTKERGFVQKTWAPQLWVLSHRAVGGFLTHCGWNSTQESICRGVAMLTWPLQAEQAMNARFIVDDLKTGLELCTVTDRFISKKRIADVVKLFMTEGGATARRNARKLQSLALNAVEEGGSSHKNLENFLAELRSVEQQNHV